MTGSTIPTKRRRPLGRAGLRSSEESLAIAVRPGLDEVCRAQHPRLVGMIGLYCGDRHLAEELAQEALVRLCRNWDRFDADDDAERWLTRVAFNLAKSSFRTTSTRRRIVARYGPTMGSSPDGADSTDALAVRAAVAALPERQRRAIILRYFADLSVADTAVAMACPEGTVKTLTFAAMASLRRAGLEVSE